METNQFIQNKKRNQQYILNLRKQLTLDDSESFFYSLVENIPQYIFCKDVEGRFTFVNQLFCNLLEKPIEEILGKTDFDFFPPELAKKYRNDDLNVIESNQTFEDIEKNKIEEHETKYVHVVKTPIYNAKGEIIGIQGIFWDITKRIKAEQELRNAHELLKQDLIAAAKVQRGFIPEKPPEITHYRFNWVFEPSEYVGGDLLNILKLSETQWAFYVLDVSGHGVSSALLSVTLTRMIDQLSYSHELRKKSIFENPNSNVICDPRQIVYTLNKRFPGDKTKFCTLLYAILDTEENSVSWVRAGHLPPLLLKNNGQETQYHLDDGGSCISQLFMNKDQMHINKTTLEPGDRFLLYSDGIIETRKEKKEYGYDRLANIMQASSHQPLYDSLKAVYKDSLNWSEQQKFHDDVTLLALERTS